MDVARLNLSHGSYAEHEQVYAMVREAPTTHGPRRRRPVDLQGPKIRLGSFSAGPVHLDVGQRFTITTDDIDGDATGCSTTYTGLPGDVNAVT